MIESRDRDAECPTGQPVVGSPMLSPNGILGTVPPHQDMRSTGVGEDLAECESFADRQDPSRGDPLSASQEVSVVPSAAIDFVVLIDDNIQSSSIERLAHRKRARLHRHKRNRQKPKRSYGRYKSVPEEYIKTPVEFPMPDGCPEDSVVFDQTD